MSVPLHRLAGYVKALCCCALWLKSSESFEIYFWIGVVRVKIFAGVERLFALLCFSAFPPETIAPISIYVQSETYEKINCSG